MSHIGSLSSMCVGLMWSSFKKPSSSNISHIILLIFIIILLIISSSSPLSLMACSWPVSTLQPKYQYIPFQQSFPVQPPSITEIWLVASHQHVLSALPSHICTVTTSSSSTSTSTQPLVASSTLQWPWHLLWTYSWWHLWYHPLPSCLTRMST